jgi:hypothetical protein
MLSKRVCYRCRKAHKLKYDVIWGKDIESFWRRNKVRCPTHLHFWFFGDGCGAPPWCPYKLEQVVAVGRKQC